MSLNDSEREALFDTRDACENILDVLLRLEECLKVFLMEGDTQLVDEEKV